MLGHERGTPARRPIRDGCTIDTVSERTASERTAPRRALFRIPGVAVLGAALLAVAATPIAFAAPGLQVLYLVPIALAAWVLRTRTTVDAEGIVVRTLVGRRAMRWADVTSLRLDSRSRVRAVLVDKSEVPLPAVRTRHLPLLAAVSAGRLDDAGNAPTGGVQRPTRAPERAEESTPEDSGRESPNP